MRQYLFLIVPLFSLIFFFMEKLLALNQSFIDDSKPTLDYSLYLFQPPFDLIYGTYIILNDRLILLYLWVRESSKRKKSNNSLIDLKQRLSSSRKEDKRLWKVLLSIKSYWSSKIWYTEKRLLHLISWCSWLTKLRKFGKENLFAILTFLFFLRIKTSFSIFQRMICLWELLKWWCQIWTKIL